MSRSALDRSASSLRAAKGSRALQFARPRLEQLESREMLSASGWHASFQLTARPAYTYTGSGYIYTPNDIRTLYGFNQFNYYGQGQTIAIVDAYDDPNIYADLMAFDKTFGLPGQSWSDIGNYFVKANQYGATNAFPQADSGWALEESLDVEWAHAVAPYARIVLIEANSASLSDLLGAVDLARYVSGVSVVSMSWGGSEFSSEASLDGYFTTPSGHNGVTFVASSGDNGAWYGPEWPSVSPNVLAVGGTSLYPNYFEAGWNGSGGGYSAFEAEPSYQYTVHSAGRRTTPDVAYNADPNTGYYVYDTFAASGWYDVGGTSAGAPQWAGLIAVGNSFRAAYGLGSAPNVQVDLYYLGSTFFRDITYGSNGYSAYPGYDLVTGRGSPNANWIIWSMAAYNWSTYGGSYSVSGGYTSYNYWGSPSFARNLAGVDSLSQGQEMGLAPTSQPAQAWDPFSSPIVAVAPSTTTVASPVQESRLDSSGTTTTAQPDDLIWVAARLDDE